MKKLLVYFCFMLPGMLTAQIPTAGLGPHIKLSDVVANYQKTHPYFGKINNPLVKSILPGLAMEQDERDLQFERWLWYWKQHTDGNGYLVTPAKTWEEWQKVRERREGAAAERTTSGVSPAWVFEGPDSSGANGDGVGRLNVVAFHPTDLNTFWVGSPGGGVWKTTNNGATWTSLTDQLPLLSVSGITINPLNPNTIYICTGDRDAGDYAGIGVLKTTDGGVTWNTTGISWSSSVYNIATSLVINPLDTNSLILSTNDGMYRSFNGGATFTLVAAGDFPQVLYSPDDTNIVYATSFMNDGTTPITFAQIWRSTDGGSTWAQQTNYADIDRVALAVTPAAPNIVTAVASAAYTSPSGNVDGLDGIYKSSDHGNSFTKIYTGNCFGSNLLSFDANASSCGGQGFYDLAIAMSLTDSNIVLTGGVNCFWSPDGGGSWYLASQWINDLLGYPVVHADKHCMAFNPLTPGRFFETNDGGIYSSYHPTGTGPWTDHTNRMGITEIYRTAVSNVASFAIEGAQDNGSKVVKKGGLYLDAAPGDGMGCAMDFVDSTVAYASSQHGYIFRLNPTLTAPEPLSTRISSNIIFGTLEGTGAWITPFVLLPSCHECILAGYQAVYESFDQGTSWSAISPSLTTANLSRLAVTAADPNTIFATEDAASQNIYFTSDAGASWNSMVAPYPGSLYISDIKVDPRDKDHLWVTYAGYGGPQVAEWYSATGWHQINSGLPDVPVMCLAIDALSRDMYVGTELGVYYRDSTMTSWQPFTTGMPSVEVTDIEINYATNELWASTYGRSLWRSPKHTTTAPPSVVPSVVPFANDNVIVRPNPNHGAFSVTARNIPDGRVIMRLTNVQGNIVWSNKGEIREGRVGVNALGIVAGVYIFEVISGNAVEGRQMVTVY